jgi:hypothetical protein
LLNTAGFDFSVAASALNPSTIAHGQSTTSTLNLSALNSFKIPVSLTCSVQPAQAGSPTCSINPSSVAFDASGKAIAQLTVSEGAAAASIRPQSAPEASQPWSFEWFPIVGLALAGAGFQRNYSIRRRVLAIFVGVVLFAGLISQFACGGSSGPKAQEFTVTVNATSGTAQLPTALSLTVQ